MLLETTTGQAAKVRSDAISCSRALVKCRLALTFLPADITPGLCWCIAAGGSSRWPLFALRASEAGFRVMCAVPLQVRKNVIGALNLFRGTDEPFSDTELEIAQATAEIAAIAD